MVDRLSLINQADFQHFSRAMIFLVLADRLGLVNLADFQDFLILANSEEFLNWADFQNFPRAVSLAMANYLSWVNHGPPSSPHGAVSLAKDVSAVDLTGKVKLVNSADCVSFHLPARRASTTRRPRLSSNSGLASAKNRL
jgi:hypothetical protein